MELLMLSPSKIPPTFIFVPKREIPVPLVVTVFAEITVLFELLTYIPSKTCIRSYGRRIRLTCITFLWCFMQAALNKTV